MPVSSVALRGFSRSSLCVVRTDKGSMFQLFRQAADVRHTTVLPPGVLQSAAFLLEL